jgi:lactate dehydrogenase-like 2-hydroxyacid dehydrogenase
MCLLWLLGKVSLAEGYTISDLVADRATRYPGKWQGPITAGGKEECATLGHDPKGKVLGILGMGGIGRVSCAYTDPEVVCGTC